MHLEAMAIDGGFADAVLDSQSAFRSVMDAMARPGRVEKALPATKPPAPLSPEAGAVALTLCDADTPVWLDPVLQAEESVADWLSFHTGAPVAHTPAEAHFAFVADPAALISLDNFAQGTQAYPDRSTTIVLQVDTLADGGTLILEGPGIAGTASLAPRPLPRHFAEQWAQNNARFPRGVDLILVSRLGLAALPRTTRITRQEA